MKRINDVKISTKLFLGFLSVLVLTAVVGVIALVKLSALNHSTSELADNWTLAVRATSDLNGRLADIRRIELAYQLRDDSAEARAGYERELADDLEKAKKDMADYEPTLTYPEEKKLYAEFKEIYPKFLARHDSFLNVAKQPKEIAEMIQSVQAETRGAVEKMQSGTQQVEKGVEVTAKAGESLKQIIGQAEHVGEMVTHIATAATEQSSATEQVNNNMDQINRLVAESADGAQQSAKACEQLSGLALELQNLVSRFKVRQQTTGGYGSPRQATPDPARVRTALALAPRPPVQHALHQGGHDRNGD